MDAPSNQPQVQSQSVAPQPCWQPVAGIDRRVLGVLVEKAKTTPDIYPMSLNAICTGCNQKNNRSPLMELEADQVEESLDRLREMGAVVLVEGYGRVQKYRHTLHDWLGVDKVELAVMTELLLRGDQTVGELRGRASRMEPIADLAALRPVLDSLKNKGLLVSLSPEGRGQVVSHALYTPREMDALKAKYAGGWTPESGSSAGNSVETATHGQVAARPAVQPIQSSVGDEIETLRREAASLRQQIEECRREIEEIRSAHARVDDEVRQLKDALGG